jgi:hypothetical protein
VKNGTWDAWLAYVYKEGSGREVFRVIVNPFQSVSPASQHVVDVVLVRTGLRHALSVLVVLPVDRLEIRPLSLATVFGQLGELVRWAGGGGEECGYYTSSTT